MSDGLVRGFVTMTRKKLTYPFVVKGLYPIIIVPSSIIFLLICGAICKRGWELLRDRIIVFTNLVLIWYLQEVSLLEHFDYNNFNKSQNSKWFL